MDLENIDINFVLEFLNEINDDLNIIYEETESFNNENLTNEINE